MARSKQQFSTLSLRPRAPAEQLVEHPASVRRKLPLTAQAAAAYALRLEEDLPTAAEVADAAAWRAEVKPLRGVSRRDDGGDVHVVGAASRARRRSLMGPRRQSAGTVRRSCGGDMPPVVQGRGSAFDQPRDERLRGAARETDRAWRARVIKRRGCARSGGCMKHCHRSGARALPPRPGCRSSPRTRDAHAEDTQTRRPQTGRWWPGHGG
jgi:hypothetical protein